MAAYAATVTLTDTTSHRLIPGLRIVMGTVDVTNYNTTLAEITDITKHFRDAPTVLLGGISDNGFLVAWNSSSKAVKAWYPTIAQSQASVTELDSTGGGDIEVTDLDAAAATGVAVYVHLDEVMEQGGYLGHLEFVSPTNTDGSGTASSGGASYKLQDDDAAATGGLALYFDEDGTAGARFIANTVHPVYIQLSNGEYLHVTHNADPGTPGVQVYFDEDGANSYERLLFVSPTDADGSDSAAGATVAAVAAGAGSEVASDVDVGSVPFVAFAPR